MTRLMFDANDPYDIPSDAEVVAGYIDGIYMWRQNQWDRFTTMRKVSISAVGVRWDADLLDVEPGCIWPPENVLPLIVTARMNDRWPAVYCNQVQHWPYVRRMFQMRNMEEPPYIVSNYDGVAEIPPGAVGKQFMHPPQTGKHYDLSVIREDWTPGRKERDDVSFKDTTTNAWGGTVTYETIMQELDRRSYEIVVALAALADKVDRIAGVTDPEVVAQRAKELIVEDLADENAVKASHPHPGEYHQGL